MNTRTTTIIIAALICLVGLALVADRGGVIAWVAFIAGFALLVKSRLKPAQRDTVLAAGLAAVLVITWAGIHRYVISTWESGEVVELSIETSAGNQIARLWVLDIDAQPTVYYDAPPAAAESMLAGTPLQFTRAGETSIRIPDATRAEELSEAQAKLVLDTMGSKYGDRNDAATIYYLMLGRPAERVALVARLVEA